MILCAVCLASAPISLGAKTPRPLHHGLLISDIHFDPLANADVATKLMQRPIDAWTGILDSSKADPFARTGSDANYSLVRSALEQARAQVGGDIVIYTGDLLRHSFKSAFMRAGGTDAEYQKFAIKTAVFMVRELQSTLKAPVVFAVGNNDSAEGDYAMSMDNDMFAALADELRILSKYPEARASFRHGGYYSIPSPIIPKEGIIVLNSVLWSPSYRAWNHRRAPSSARDPGLEELQWLYRALAQAHHQRRKVILVMHIPPGDDAFASAAKHCAYVPLWSQGEKPDYFAKFARLMREYRGVVQLAFAGHTHMDDFRVMHDDDTPFLPIRITPAVSPKFGNNPGFSEFDYNSSTGAVADIATYRSPGSANKKWSLEYRFSRAYGCYEFTARNLYSLARRIRKSGKVREIWESHYAVGATSPINARNWPCYANAETNFTGSTRSASGRAAGVR